MNVCVWSPERKAGTTARGPPTPTRKSGRGGKTIERLIRGGQRHRQKTRKGYVIEESFSRRSQSVSKTDQEAHPLAAHISSVLGSEEPGLTTQASYRTNKLLFFSF